MRPSSRDGREGGRRAERGPERGASSRPRRPLFHPAVPLADPTVALLALVAAALVVVVVTFPISDPDIWQHLTVGRAIWKTHSIPRTHLWSWPTYGTPEVLPSWLFRAVLWPVYAAGGVNGLFVWRWVTTLAAFAIGWAGARRMGARGFSPLVAAVLCAMVDRGRTQARPETLVAPLFALAIYALVWRRDGGRLRVAGRALDPALLLVPVTWIWANAHLSYWLTFLLLGGAWLDERLGRRVAEEGSGAGAVAAPDAHPRFGLVAIAVVAALVAFANPFGWRALWQPFEYFLFWRQEPIFRNIGELAPVDWSVNLKNGLPLLVVAWPLLALWRVLAGRRDVLELVLCGTLLPLTLGGQRFMGFLAVAAAPFLGRDLAELAARLARGLTAPWPRFGAAVAAIALLAAPLLADAPHWFGTGLDLRRYPVGACDFMEREGLKGRIYNAFFHGGYLLWRFWPDRDRLPFMDIHQSGTRADRDGQAYARGMESAWRALDASRKFEIFLGPRYDASDADFLDRRDRDSTWALVFVDDAVALYVRREPQYASLIAGHEYHALCGGEEKLEAFQARAMRDSTLRTELARELNRAILESPASSRAFYVRGALAAYDGRLDAAAADFRRSLAVDPDTHRAHEGLGAIALAQGDARAAVREFLAEGSMGDWPPGTRVRLGAAYAALHDRTRAAAAYRAELAADPGSTEARDSLAALEGRR